MISGSNDRARADLFEADLALSQNFRVHMWELRKEWAARKNQDVTSSMGRLKHWASDMEAHAKKMSGLEDGINNSIVEIFGAALRPLTDKDWADEIEYGDISS